MGMFSYWNTFSFQLSTLITGASVTDERFVFRTLKRRK